MSDQTPEPSDHLDEATLTELESLLEDDFIDLVETFLSDSQHRFDDLTQTVNSTVAEDIRRAAHSFKGSSLNVGAIRLSSLCKALEDQAREGRVAQARDYLDRIQDEMAVVDQLFRERYL